MSSFTFVPRSISKGKIKKPLSTTVAKSTSSQIHPQPNKLLAKAGPSSELVQLNTSHENLEKQNKILGELLALLELSLSDYSLWCNPDLQHAVQSGHDGYVPLKYLIENIADVSEFHPRPSEVDLMKAARTSPLFETRMMIAEPSRNTWFGRNTHEPEDSGFEIRRSNWQTVMEHSAEGGRKKDEWDQYTIYIERMPIAYRTKPKIARYIQTLLSRQGDHDSPSKITVQSITFPRHQMAAPNEQPRCKGFAFIVLDSPESVEALCESYPWKGRNTSPVIDSEASKFGTRVIAKDKWDVLKSEYLAYQKQLLSQISEKPEALENNLWIPEEFSSKKAAKSTIIAPLHASPPQEEEVKEPSCWYPQNCLLFVRNVHPDTNKTTLRALFTGVLSDFKDNVDYVDFNKGIDSCHIRFASPLATAALVSYFTDNEVAQGDPLDQDGTTPSPERPRIFVELVQGKREELYWGKVPEKAREAALTRLYSVHRDRDAGDVEPTPEGIGGKRKRRKHL